MKKISDIRKDFPILQENSQGEKTLIFLDSAATGQKPYMVIEAEADFYKKHNAPVHRGLYPLAENATIYYEHARETVARFINAKNNEIIFTKGTTEGINFVATTWAQEFLKPGDEIVITQAEHHANLVPWQLVAEKTGAKLVFIPIDATTYKPSNPTSYITSKTKLVALSHTSNVIGQLWDHYQQELEHIIQHAHDQGAYVLIDAAQAVAHQKIDTKELGADFVVFSAHKIFGPTGIGVLYINEALHDHIQPYQRGGSMVYEVWNTGARWAKSPQKFEAGTPPIAQAIGLAAAVNYINDTIDFSLLKKHEASLCSLLINGLKKIQGVTIVGNHDWINESGHLVTIAFDAIHPHDVASQLGFKNIAVRAGHFCAQPLAVALGFASFLRVSVAVYNNEQDIEMFLQELQSCVEYLKGTLTT